VPGIQLCPLPYSYHTWCSTQIPTQDSVPRVANIKFMPITSLLWFKILMSNTDPPLTITILPWVCSAQMKISTPALHLQHRNSSHAPDLATLELQFIRCAPAQLPSSAAIQLITPALTSMCSCKGTKLRFLPSFLYPAVHKLNSQGQCMFQTLWG
jgi:hypothetical protein